MCILAMGLNGIAAFLPVFGEQQPEYWREASSLPQPKHSIAYFIGKDLAMLPQVRTRLRVIATPVLLFDFSCQLCRLLLVRHCSQWCIRR